MVEHIGRSSSIYKALCTNSSSKLFFRRTPCYDGGTDQEPQLNGDSDHGGYPREASHQFPTTASTNAALCPAIGDAVSRCCDAVSYAAAVPSAAGSSTSSDGSGTYTTCDLVSTLAAGAGAPLPSTVVTLHCWNGDAGPAAAAPAVGTGTNPTPKRNILRLRGGDCTAPSGLKDFTVFNIRGLKPRTRPSKVPYIRDILHETKQLFIVLTETWLYEQSDAEIDIDGYTLFRADRKVKKKSKHGRDSGGVAIYVRDDIAVDAERNLEFSNGVVEALAVHIPQIDTVAVGFYRSPENPATPDVKSGHSQLSQCITQLKEYFCNLPAPTPNIVICGDANLPSADWMEGICRTGTNRYREEQKMVSSLYEFASENFMVQQIEEPTHRDGNILDLIFTNNADIVHSYDIVPSSQSDHLMINVKANYSVTSHDVPTQEDEIEEEVSFRSLNFFHESTDWNGLNDSIAQHDWASEFESSDANEMLNRFVYTCLDDDDDD